MSRRLRTAGLPAAALLLVGGVLGVQVAYGGGSFEPLHPGNPCTARPLPTDADGIDGLTERLVLLGVDRAACDLHVSREALTLDLADPGARTDAEVDALHRGLLAAVREMKADGSLPPASALVDDALDSLDLNAVVKAAIRAVPDGVVDAALKTDDVLTRTVDDLDLRELLANLDDPQELDAQLRRAVTDAIKDSLAARVRGLL